MDKPQHTSIEKARSEYHGSEFGKYEEPPSPCVGILWLWAIAVFVALFVLAVTACSPTEEITPAEAQAMRRAYNSPACRLHKNTEDRMQCAIDQTQGV